MGPCFDLYEEEWKFIKHYHDEYRQVVSVSEFLNKFDGFDFVENPDGVIEYYIDEVFKGKARRELQGLLSDSATSLRDMGPYNVINNINKTLSKLSRDTRQVRDFDLVLGAEERAEALRERLELRKSGRKTLGIPSGIEAIDNAFGGWMKSDFVVLAAWTGNMKSWLALYMAINAWRQGYRVLYFSLEMSAEQLGYRMDTLLGEGMWSHTSLTFAQEDITYDHYKTWQGEMMRDKSSFIVVSNEDLEEVNQDTVRSKMDYWKPDLVVIDYIQLMDEASGITGETEKLKQLSKALKKICIKTSIPIIVISSVTQDKNDLGNEVPELADLAWSKQLAFDSDLTLCMCKRQDQLEIRSRKNRRGKDIVSFLNWDIDRGIVSERKSGGFRNGNQDTDQETEEDSDISEEDYSKDDQAVMDGV